MLRTKSQVQLRIHKTKIHKQNLLSILAVAQLDVVWFEIAVAHESCNVIHDLIHREKGTRKRTTLSKVRIRS